MRSAGAPGSQVGVWTREHRSSRLQQQKARVMSNSPSHCELGHLYLNGNAWKSAARGISLVSEQLCWSLSGSAGRTLGANHDMCITV
ncbi:gamma-aminobutyric acid receptor subunit alpha-2 [Labeo rohita]|uniref:Gamma-aminobutyric acid receptor subunit alpha-2 n=1 Tax=Labeo rohita TaxID=84645 RepID=A0A498NA12_LABRO|nr:gamma-aminobutyric acid receptor subunit alpha-2 [Labeo rohita]